MKKIIGLVLLSVLVLQSDVLVAQTTKLSKAEKKKVKKELRKYKKDPASYVDMMDKKNSTIKDQEAVIEELNNQLIELRNRSKSQSDSMQLLEQKLAKLMEKYKDATASADLPSGTVYQVQIGYYKKLNLKAFNKRLKYVKAEQQGGGKRYVIGYFTDLNSAKSFNSDLRKLGVSDAFVTKYVDGKREMGFDANKH